MSDHHFNRYTCGCHSRDHSHYKQCGCRMKHNNHHDFCSCNSSRQHDTCKCKRVKRFPRNHFRRHDDFNKRNRNGTSSSFARLSPLRHSSHGNGDDSFTRDHDKQLHGRNHSNNETIRLNKNDGKKNIVIIM